MNEPKGRSLSQNARMWSMLRDVSRDVVWHGQRLSDSDWKEVFSACLKQQRVVPGIETGFVILGCSTRVMKVAEMAELMELIEAFGAQHDVRFTAPAYDEEHA